MHNAAAAFAFMQAREGSQIFRAPSYFEYVIIGLLVAGALGWLVAAVLGFSRARGFGSSVRWFALSAACMIVYHVHLFAVGVVMAQRDNDTVLSLGAFFNLFVVLGSVCAVIGFVQLNKQP